MRGDVCCQRQRILELLTFRVITADRARLHSSLMTAWQSPVHHMCTQTNTRAILPFPDQTSGCALVHARTHTRSLICLSLSSPQCNYADVITLD